jgi:hypothetical protein
VCCEVTYLGQEVRSVRTGPLRSDLKGAVAATAAEEMAEHNIATRVRKSPIRFTKVGLEVFIIRLTTGIEPMRGIKLTAGVTTARILGPI